MIAILEIEKLRYLGNGLIDRREIWHGHKFRGGRHRYWDITIFFIFQHQCVQGVLKQN